MMKSFWGVKVSIEDLYSTIRKKYSFMSEDRVETQFEYFLELITEQFENSEAKNRLLLYLLHYMEHVFGDDNQANNLTENLYKKITGGQYNAEST